MLLVPIFNREVFDWDKNARRYSAKLSTLKKEYNPTFRQIYEDNQHVLGFSVRGNSLKIVTFRISRRLRGGSILNNKVTKWVLVPVTEHVLENAKLLDVEIHVFNDEIK